MFLDAPRQRWISVLAVMGCLLLVGLLLLSAIQRARHAARVSQSRFNLQSLGMAIISYQCNHSGALPPGGVFLEDGTPMHGWPGLIRPYVDASPWYTQLDLVIRGTIH